MSEFRDSDQRAETPVAASRDTAAAASRLRTPVTAASVVLLAVAVVAAAWFGGRWVVGAYFTDGPRTDARNELINDAQQAAINLLSINPDDVDGSLANIRSSMTGSLLDEQTKEQDRIKQQAIQSKGRVVVKPEEVALTSLNSERDHASVFLVLRVTRSFPDTPPESFRQLWTLDMVEAGDTWKAEQAKSLGKAVPLDSGAPPAPAQPPADQQPPRTGR
ncbi:hypothetical protein [Nocardia transvalensis]|uniref:hypothetical protein n=1 Tax=Nocardia transvalensis TaxID=37333 RepID=UPI001894EB7D|nr:hypothetical protein [Nocardia transvalensis]MBF6333681.1 hypothetical protein [Nocardia transvalensis]